jgi:pSer/pThr/pTyr-binding forkhead associated (FHA) protein
MSFVIQRPSGRGLALSQVRVDTLRIGRGTNAELRSENPAVALEHAVIEADTTGFTIIDRGSITGTYVNGRPVESARLAKGDVIEIGDLKIEVQIAEPLKPLFIRVAAMPRGVTGGADDDDDAVATPRAPGGGGQVRAPKVDYVDAYRLRRNWMTKASIIAILLIVTLLAIGEVTKPEKRKAFMPGGVSSAHMRAHDPKTGEPIATNCRSCHDPWNGVSDNSCTVCHGKKPHAEEQTGAPACADCHPEHRGVAKLAASADNTCVSCHANVAAHVRDPKLLASQPPEILSITGFGSNHPGFTPRTDPDTLRFNHALHLKPGGVPNAEGQREELKCEQCHKLVETKAKTVTVDPVALRFQDHCQRCHKLTFDPNFPNAEAPHGGDPGQVYGFIILTYTGNRDIAGKSPEELRRILTSRSEVAPDERAVLYAEQVVKTKCSHCHTLRRVGSLLVATPPEIPARWFLKSRFTHTPHRGVPCETCHEMVRRSTMTSDVLMPSRKDCTPCHGDRTAKISSSCATCHEYHERSRILLTKPLASSQRIPPVSVVKSDLGEGGERMLETVLLWAIVLLLLVVLAPAGVALYQKIKASEPERPKAQKTPAAPPPARVPPPMQAAAPAPPPAAPAPAPHAPTPRSPDMDATRVELAPSASAGGPAVGGTEMVEWYGLIQCTGGPLEGQRFIVEPGGIYIGRDPALSQVHISDSRISKRHVRIIPRDGKVWAIDQNSTNGTFLGKAGGERVSEHQLKRGDTLVLADNAATFVYQI